MIGQLRHKFEWISAVIACYCSIKWCKYSWLSLSRIRLTQIFIEVPNFVVYKYMWIVYFCKSFCKQILGNSYLCCMCDLYLKNTFQAPHSGIAVVVLDRHCILTKCNDTKKKQCMDFFTRLGEICLGYRLWEKKHLSLYLNSNHVSN